MVAALCGFPARLRPRPHAGPAPRRCYERRRPEKTPLHKIVSENLASWLEWRDQAERPVPGSVEEEFRSFLECGILCFGSALNRHVHLHACVTDGVFVPPADGAGCDAPPAFLPARPIIQADLAAVTEKVRRRLIRWFRRTRLLNAEAAADMLAWENSGFSVDASVRIALIDRDVPSYFRSLEHLLRYCARPPFALERLAVTRDTSGSISRIRYALPRHKAATWVGPGRGRKSTRPGANGVVELTPFEFLDRLADLVPPPRKHRHRYHGVFAPNHPLRPAVTSLAIGNVGKRPRLAGMRVTGTARGAAVAPVMNIKSPAHMTPRALPGRSSWRGWGRIFPWRARTAAATSD